ncbi:MAG TPA: CRISPR-associated protein Csx19 [Rhodothermales bacterium]|nr:CRISPR-associated protein Csx19 [Rhodothermales bacterium]HRR07707.1 CRISPR-associated protein Csx19 [Rhodothermales bacterium]
MQRKLENCNERLIIMDDAPKHGVLLWLNQKANGYQYLLAFCDEGVIWGRVEEDKIVFPKKSVQPLFLDLTLQEVRLFGKNGELYLWKTEDGFHARSIHIKKTDEDPTWSYQHNEQYYLWGHKVQDIENGFTCLQEGKQGMRHVVPIQVKDSQDLKLVVRHFLTQEGFEPLRVVTSRLVDICE